MPVLEVLQKAAEEQVAQCKCGLLRAAGPGRETAYLAKVKEKQCEKAKK